MLAKLARGDFVKTPVKTVVDSANPSKLNPVNVFYNAGYISVVKK